MQSFDFVARDASPCLKTSGHTLDPSPIAQHEGIGARLPFSHRLGHDVRSWMCEEFSGQEMTDARTIESVGLRLSRKVTLQR